MDAAIPADAQNAPTGMWKSRTEREIPTAPPPIIVVVNERKNNGDSNSVAKPSTESDQAHQNQVEAAYARSDLFERRRRLMDDWAAAVCQSVPVRRSLGLIQRKASDVRLPLTPRDRMRPEKSNKKLDPVQPVTQT